MGDSIYAQGVVDNLVVTLPPPPIQNLAGAFRNSVWQAQFSSQTNGLYTLERTSDFQSWTTVSPTILGDGTKLLLQDASPPADKAFYRVSTVTLSALPIKILTGAFCNGVWQAQFFSQSNWLYTLERTSDFQSWTNASPVTLGNATELLLQDANPPADKAFYRVSASRP